MDSQYSWKDDKFTKQVVFLFCPHVALWNSGALSSNQRWWFVAVGFLLRNVLFTGPRVAWQMLLMFCCWIFAILYKFWILVPFPGYTFGKNFLPFCGLCSLLIVIVLYINFLISCSPVCRILGLLPVLLEFCSQSFHWYLDSQIIKGILCIQEHRSYHKDIGLCFSEIGQLTSSILKPVIRI